MFPALARALPIAQLASLAALSFLVGMRCPGHDSVFSSFVASENDRTSADGQYAVTRFDERFSLAEIQFTLPGLDGSIQAFRRPTPPDQASMAEVKRLVDGNEFAGVRALVVGGSRGLGETTAKILCAGGAEVRLTCRSGTADAQRVCAEIRQLGGTCSSHALDVLTLSTDNTRLFADWTPNALFYYPTPPIFQGKRGAFSPELFNHFCEIYINGFHKTVDAIPLGESETLSVLYPSTIAIEELPADMVEYVCAKATGETLCQFISRYDRRISIHCPRLPRMKTDQTASVVPVRSADPVDLLLPLVRDMFKAT